MVRLTKIKTKRGKRALDDREPKTIENDKKAFLVRGGKTNNIVSSAMKDIYALKKPLAFQLKRKNPFHPFEDENPLVQFGQKMDASLFLFASNSKKHPNSLIFGRLYDGNLLDMAELRIKSYKPASEFDVPQMTLGSKPCLLFEGNEFESDSDMKRVNSLLVDFFRGAVVDQVRLQGLEAIISFTAKENELLMRVYRICLKKSGSTLPRVELQEMGPSIDFTIERKKLASDDLYKLACKKPKAVLAKRRKNMAEDVFGNQLARVHIGKQNTDAIQTRKVKALRRPLEKAAQAQPVPASDDEEDMEE